MMRDGGSARRIRSVALAALCVLCVAAAGRARAVEKEAQVLASAEFEGRRVIKPADLKLDLEWYSPIVGPQAGRMIRGWVSAEVILLETDLHNLIAVRRSDGTELWRVELEGEVRYTPVVSRNNVVVNVKNWLVAVDRREGRIRWRLEPDFVMSGAPLVIDPEVYPKNYTKEWVNQEQVYVGSWHGRLQAMTVRARMASYAPGLVAPEFELEKTWHRTLPSRGKIVSPLAIVDDLIYFASDDNRCYAYTRDGEGRNPYLLQDLPSSQLSTDEDNLYVGSHDFSMYALDRLTLRRKWSYAAGSPPVGKIFADEPSLDTYVFLPTKEDGVHALKIVRPQVDPNRSAERVESFSFAWKLPADGVVAASESDVVMGVGGFKDFPGYKNIAVVDKATGKVRWKTGEERGVSFYLQFHNAWKSKEGALRIYAVTEDNRLLSFREITGNAGPVKKKEEAPAAPVAPVKKEEAPAPAPAPDAGGGAAPAPGGGAAPAPGGGGEVQPE